MWLYRPSSWTHGTTIWQWNYRPSWIPFWKPLGGHGCPILVFLLHIPEVWDILWTVLGSFPQGTSVSGGRNSVCKLWSRGREGQNCFWICHSVFYGFDQGSFHPFWSPLENSTLIILGPISTSSITSISRVGTCTFLKCPRKSWAELWILNLVWQWVGCFCSSLRPFWTPIPGTSTSDTRSQLSMTSTFLGSSGQRPSDFKWSRCGWTESPQQSAGISALCRHRKEEEICMWIDMDNMVRGGWRWWGSPWCPFSIEVTKTSPPGRTRGKGVSRSGTFLVLN